MRPLCSAVITILALCAFGTSAAAQAPRCGQRAGIIDQLATKYQETPSQIGLESSGALIEVLTSKDGETWTIILSWPGGTSCLLAAGSDWQPVVRELTGPAL